MDHEGKATKAASTGIPEGGRSSEVGVPVEPSHEDDRVDAPSGPSGPAKAAAPPHPPGPHPPNPHPSTPPAQPPAAAQGAAQGEAAPASPAKKKRKPKTPRKPKPNHLRKYRQELCLSQAELARRANLSVDDRPNRKGFRVPHEYEAEDSRGSGSQPRGPSQGIRRGGVNVVGWLPKART